MMLTYCSPRSRRSAAHSTISNQKESSSIVVPNSYDNRSFLLESFPDYNTFAKCLSRTDNNHCHHHNTKLFEATTTLVTKAGIINSSACGITGSCKKANKQATISSRARDPATTNSKNFVFSSNDVVLTIENRLPPIINDLCCSNRHRQQHDCISSASSSTSKKTTPAKQDPSVIKVPSTFSTSRSKQSLHYEKDQIVKTKCNTSRYQPSASLFDGPKQNNIYAWNVMSPVTATLLDRGRKELEDDKVETLASGNDAKEVLMEIGKVCEEDGEAHVIDQDEDADNQYTINTLPPKPYRRIQRSMTIDESITMHNSRKEDTSLHRCKSIDSLRESIVDERTLFLEEKGPNHLAQGRKTSVQSKQRSSSKKKTLKRSMSLGFSKFKSLTMFKPHHQRFDDEDVQLDFNDADHQTSRRKNTVSGPSPDLITDDDEGTKAVIDESFEKFDKLTGNQLNHHLPLMRSLSAPDPIDDKFGDADGVDEDEYDEDLSELHLPRRKAICPNLPVPAMKQLKTYLILTRLKQYCFV